MRTFFGKENEVDVTVFGEVTASGTTYQENGFEALLVIEFVEERRQKFIQKRSPRILQPVRRMR